MSKDTQLSLAEQIELLAERAGTFEEAHVPRKSLLSIVKSLRQSAPSELTDSEINFAFDPDDNDFNPSSEISKEWLRRTRAVIAADRAKREGALSTGKEQR